MDNEKLVLLRQSFFDLALEMEKALTDEKRVEEIQYFFLRAYRLLSKANRFIHRQDYISLIQSIEEKLSEWHGKLAGIYENNRDFEAAEREWLASLAFFHPASDKYLQYAHTSLNRHDLFLEREIKENMVSVTKTNVSDIMTSLRRAKFAVNTAEAEYGKTDQTQYVLVWIGCMIQAIEGDEELNLALIRDERNETLDQVLDELNSLIGLPEVKTKMKEVCDWVIFNQLRTEQGFKTSELSLHMIFTGHPGTGKTTVARLVARIFKALGVLKKGHLVEADRSDLVAEYVGQTAVKTKRKLKEAKDGVLFIDEAYSLSRFSGNDFGIEAIDTIVKAMEDNRGNLVIILAGYPNEMDRFMKANPGLFSRFQHHVNFKDYTIFELMMIADLFLKQKQYKLTSEAIGHLEEILQNKVEENKTSHGNGRLVRNLIEKAILAKASKVVTDVNKGIPNISLDVIDVEIMKNALADQLQAAHCF